jgi:hypothetical protein
MEPVRSVMGELAAIPAAAEHLAGLVSGLSIRYDVGATGHPLLGLRLSPEWELRPAGGRLTQVADLLHAARGVLIVTGAAAGAAEAAAGWRDRVDVVAGEWEPGRTPGAVPPPAAVLVRPDGHVAWAAPDGGSLSDALGRWFGPADVAAGSATAR